MQLISILVPVYNVEKYLPQCLESIIKQTYKDLEIILVDDGSTDKSGEICDEYAQKDLRIRVIHQQNKGRSMARNTGIKASTGEYVLFVDSDDWIEKDMVEYLFEIVKNTGAQIALCGYNNIDEKGQTKVTYEEQILSGEQVLVELCKDEKIKNYLWNQLIERELLEGITFPEGRNFEDILTIYQWVEKTKKVAFGKEAKYNYCRRKDSLTIKKSAKTNFERCKAHELRYCDLGKRRAELKPILLKQIFTAYRKMIRDGVYEKTERAMLSKSMDFYQKIVWSIVEEADLSAIEKKEAKVLNGYQGGTCLKLWILELLRLFEKQLRRS